MSKSETGGRGHAVRLLDTPDEIRTIIGRAVTDSGTAAVFSETPEKAGVNNLLEIFSLLSGLDHPATEAHFAGKGYGALKAEVAAVVIEALRPIRERYAELSADPAGVEAMLAAGAARARAVAEPKIEEIKRTVGLILTEKKS